MQSTHAPAAVAILSIGSDDGEFRHGPRRQRNNFVFLGFCRCFDDERLLQIIFQQMLAGGEARGGFRIVHKTRDAKNDCIRGLLGPESSTAFHAALAQGASESQHSCQDLNIFLLFRG